MEFIFRGVTHVINVRRSLRYFFFPETIMLEHRAKKAEHNLERLKKAKLYLKIDKEDFQHKTLHFDNLDLYLEANNCNFIDSTINISIKDGYDREHMLGLCGNSVSFSSCSFNGNVEATEQKPPC